MRAISNGHGTEGAFRHEALFYAGEGEFVERTGGFIRDSLEAEEPILVVVGAEKIDMLRSEIGPDADDVRFLDMARVGQNPATIIPLWQEFVEETAPAGRPFRGVGEPIWPERSPEELVECERHESLLNLAFAGAPRWWLVCPYDTGALEPSVIEEAMRNHPSAFDGEARRTSSIYRNLGVVGEPFDRPLPDPDGRPEEIRFEMGWLSEVRQFVVRRAAAYGLAGSDLDDLLVAINEVMSNSIRHGGGEGILRMWRTDRSVVCEVRDTGRIEHPMVGRVRPLTTQVGGYGLWIVNHLCDLVQVRTFETGSVVRLHKRLGGSRGLAEAAAG
jgi:anti-sigma regulatory factor (Ser/Thr protein kinase)